jgi:hypothetical protein
MKRCPKCGRTEPSSARFCTGCGSPLEESYENPFRQDSAPAGTQPGNPNESLFSEAAFSAANGQPLATQTAQKKKSKVLPIVITAVAIVAIVAIVVGVLMLKNRTVSSIETPEEEPTQSISIDLDDVEEETESPSGILGGAYDTEAPESETPQAETSQEPEEVEPVETPEESPEETPQETNDAWTPVEEEKESESPAVTTHTYDGVTIQGDYVFSDSNSRYLTESDLSGLSVQELDIARNEIYARRGRQFTTDALQAYFNSCSWYSAKYTADQFDQKVTLNDYEKKNAALILEYEKEKGYR